MGAANDPHVSSGLAFGVEYPLHESSTCVLFIGATPKEPHVSSAAVVGFPAAGTVVGGRVVPQVSIGAGFVVEKVVVLGLAGRAVVPVMKDVEEVVELGVPNANGSVEGAAGFTVLVGAADDVVVVVAQGSESKLNEEFPPAVDVVVSHGLAAKEEVTCCCAVVEDMLLEVGVMELSNVIGLCVVVDTGGADVDWTGAEDLLDRLNVGA